MKPWPLNKAFFWEAAPFSRLPIPLIAGIACYSYFSFNTSAVLVAIVVSLLLYVCFALIHKTKRSIRFLHFLFLHVVIFFSGWALSYYNDARHHPAWFGKWWDAGAFTAVVSKTPAEKEHTWKLEVAVTGAVTDNKVHPTIGNAFVYVFKDKEPFTLREGDTLLLPNKWQRIKNAGNPFEFDYATYCERNNIHYLQFLPQQKITVTGHATASGLSWIQRTHNWCMLQLQHYIRDTTTLGLVQAMLLGDEANMDTDLRQSYAETGIIHVVAISGSHIAFFFVIISFLLGWIKSRKRQWLKYAIALPLIWAYVLIAGAPPSAVRAAFMFSILGVGFSLRKQHNSLNQLFATAFILLCAEPMWLYAVGFQLSFIAVLSILVFYKPLYNLYRPASYVTKALWATVCVSIAAEVLTAPLVVYYFHLFPLMFIAANIAAFLLMGIVLILGMLIILLSSIPILATAIASISIWLVQYFNKLIFILQQWNPASFGFLNLSIFELALIYIAIVFTGVYLLRKKRGALFAGAATCCILIFSLCCHQWLAMHQQKLIVYNINRANHIELIQGQYYTVLQTDTGISELKKSYTLKPAHIALSAWRENHVSLPNILQVGRYSVLLLDKPIFHNTHFDYVIVNYPLADADIGRIQQAFTPEKIIIGSNIPRWQVSKYKEISHSRHIPLHCTQMDGAFVLPAL